MNKITSMLPSPKSGRLHAVDYAAGTVIRGPGGRTQAVCVEIENSERGRYWQPLDADGCPNQFPCTRMDGTIKPTYELIEICGDDTAGCVFETESGARFLSLSSAAFPGQPVAARPNAISLNGTYTLTCERVIGRWL